MKHNYFPKTSLTIKIHSIKLLTSVTTYLLLLSGNFLTAQTATLNAGSLGPWTVPAGVTSINIQAWGGGGAGGGSNSNNDGGSGGGGGGYTALSNSRTKHYLYYRRWRYRIHKCKRNCGYGNNDTFLIC